MSHRATVITQLLERYNELTDPWCQRTGNGVPGVLLRPVTDDDSVRELTRLLVVMRDDRSASLLRDVNGDKVSLRSCWWHLNARYIASETVMRTLVWRRGKWQGLGGHAEVVAQPNGWEVELQRERARRRQAGMRLRVKVCVWDPAVRSSRVDRGVVWLADNWALQHEPMLPKAVMVAA